MQSAAEYGCFHTIRSHAESKSRSPERISLFKLATETPENSQVEQNRGATEKSKVVPPNTSLPCLTRSTSNGGELPIDCPNVHVVLRKNDNITLHHGMEKQVNHTVACLGDSQNETRHGRSPPTGAASMIGLLRARRLASAAGLGAATDRSPATQSALGTTPQIPIVS